jgi:hypothetical protein
VREVESGQEEEGGVEEEVNPSVCGLHVGEVESLH